MRIATYNVNNLFERANLLEFEGFSEKATSILNDIDELNKLIKYPNYDPVKNEIITLLEKHFSKNVQNNYFIINQVKGKLFSVDDNGVTLLAKGRKDWKGWAELTRSPVNIMANQNTGRVINEIMPDVMCVVEVENSTALVNFNKQLLNNHFKYNMAFNGNDNRGIELGIYSNYAISNFKSHVFETFKLNGSRYKIFSRDCAEYEIALNNGKKLHILCNHFKSNGHGSEKVNKIKRRQQAEKVNEILKKYDLNKDFVVVSGDFNDTPESESLHPLLYNKKLINIVDNINGPKGTFLDKDEQFDYLLVSIALYGKITNIGIERRGIFNNGQVEPFDTVTSKSNHASDHALVWADFNFDRRN
jgi:endonuclease/exonuclease/phosphatase family metal-dependent hydrolase